MPSEPETAAAAFTRAGQDAVTYARRVAGDALARNERHRGENAELIKQFGRGRLAGRATDPTPGSMRGAAKRFRAARGLPVPQLPSAAELVPPKPEPSPSAARRPRPTEEEADFSESRIMIRDQ
ncbi:hypothetical protein ACFWY9_39575 [Amycolatopsis sp. NPDC059027]|uniref:hypothetical protein n=1 Tax=unclassified Amycolatopsis TaxID=2618356 RepID=UPI00366C64F6